MLITCSWVSTQPQSFRTISQHSSRILPLSNLTHSKSHFLRFYSLSNGGCVVMASEVQLPATGIADQCFREPSVLITTQIRRRTFKTSWGDVASGGVLVTKQTQHFCAKAINIFMEFRALSSNGKMLIRHFRQVSLRGGDKGTTGPFWGVSRYTLHQTKVFLMMNQFLIKPVNAQGA